MSNRATTAAKGRPKKSYARGKSRKEEDPEAMIPWMPDETFCEEMSEWVDSPEGQLWLDISDTLEVPLKHVGLDVRQRKFLWPDAKRLTLDQSVQRINQQYPDFPEAHSTAKCNGEIFDVEENLTRSSIAEYLSGARVEFILDPLDIGI
jgi:hypothetical protein